MANLELKEKLEDVLEVIENKDTKLLVKTLIRHIEKNKGKLGF